ncbi:MULTISPECIES: phosphate signaling complex protein PhoU [Halorhodospira]|uniref:phosphate signaling complex protein PhoU n=1 Tax=Halorhodospira TaxID=85108 RepID=UPI001912EB9F|nr:MULTISPECIES: phosphate signaling complex protein PhoU [Halorhodospira]MBK5942414.1 phosphate transport system regulatory protein PhoU [Halorhodospira halophila]MCG5531963.1 phosphate signaling complex protein PhoU [Halorhodospira sp. 9621]MCG5540025.1 phosphate signaling complex protein PhoU [Halorhodospira sp. M39old]MCG5544833.1 phosphate signaling complex protein PhoU [Halorhodospira sp. M38]
MTDENPTEKSFFQEHISQRFNAELEAIHDRVLSMGGLVEQQLADAVAAMAESRTELAEKVVTSDYQINALEVALDEDCTQILVRRQPTASDLRLVMAVIKTITDLERIGDEAERIGRMALHFLELDRQNGPIEELGEMGEHVQGMLRGSLDAFARMDVEQAVRVAQQDIQADSQYEVIVHRLMEQMMRSPETVPRVMDVVWTARSLERIGDRARNICEYVVYFVRGKNVRHTSFEQMAQEATGDRH